MNYSDEQYEIAVLEKLNGLHVDHGGYLKTLQAYAGDLTTDTALEQFIRGFPGLLVLIQSSDYYQQNNCFWRQEVKVALLVGARSWRSQGEARGDSTGISKIKADIRDLLLNTRLGLEIRPLELLREEFIAGDNAHVLWWIEYMITNDNVTALQEV